MQVMTSDNKAHAGYLLFPKVHELTGPVNHENPQTQILFCWSEKK
jgi:hypothetical protein